MSASGGFRYLLRYKIVALGTRRLCSHVKQIAVEVV